LRSTHARELASVASEAFDFVEVHPENYVGRGGVFRRLLDEAAERWPVRVHGLTLGLASSEPFERSYVAELKSFLDRFRVPYYSDHLCLCAGRNAHLYDLLPVPWTSAQVATTVQRLRELSDALERPVAVENVSYYATGLGDPVDEATIIAEIVHQADAALLLDVNNVYVNARNHGFEARDYLARLPLDRVAHIHVAGHLIRPDGLRIDTHGEAICDDVYTLIGEVAARTAAPILLERDGNIPPIAELILEVERLRTVIAPPSVIGAA
jgi:uncharacterized protein (UPF0276 family)